MLAVINIVLLLPNFDCLRYFDCLCCWVAEEEAAADHIEEEAAADHIEEEEAAVDCVEEEEAAVDCVEEVSLHDRMKDDCLKDL